MPLYDDLAAGVMKRFAVEVFGQTQRRLHPNLRRSLQQMLFQSGPANPSEPALPANGAVSPSPSSSATAAAINVSA